MPNDTIFSDFITGVVCFDKTVKRIEKLIIKKINEDIMEVFHDERDFN